VFDDTVTDQASNTLTIDAILSQAANHDRCMSGETRAMRLQRHAMSDVTVIESTAHSAPQIWGTDRFVHVLVLGSAKLGVCQWRVPAGVAAGGFLLVSDVS
jgi:hypothetical protein